MLQSTAVGTGFSIVMQLSCSLSGVHLYCFSRRYQQQKMHFTTSQVRAVLGLPTQTLRYWRSALSPLTSKPGGKSAKFSIGEILALAIVAKLVGVLRLDVGAISAVAPALFDLCKRSSLLANSSWLYLDIEGARVEVTSDLKTLPKDKAIVLVPISEIAREVRETLTKSDENVEQLEFSWPLAAVK